MQLHPQQQQQLLRRSHHNQHARRRSSVAAKAAAGGVSKPDWGHHQQQQQHTSSSSSAAARGTQPSCSSPRTPLVSMAATPDAAAPGQQRQQHTVKQVSFVNQDGQRLSGVLTLCCLDGGSSSIPGEEGAAATAAAQQPRCIILCHGFASCRDGFQLPKLAAALADAGFNSLRFDFAGNGASEGVFRLSRYAGEAADVASAKQFLEGQCGQRVTGLLGHSKGGDVVVLHAATHADIPRVVNVAGRYDLRDGIDTRFGADIFSRVLSGPISLPAQRDDGATLSWQLTKQDLDERLALDMPATAAQVPQHIRMLTIHGTADSVIPVTDGRNFAAVLPGHRLVEVEGADHNFRTGEEHVQQLIDAVVAFFDAAAEGRCSD